ncbi:murein biosynthesis integral membrane protein MurJ [Treponema denticola]
MGKLENKNKSLVKSGSKLSLLVLGSRVLGLVRQMTMSHFLGTGPLADAFATAFMLPNLFRRLFAENSITVAFIPTFNAYLQKHKDSQESEKTKKEINEFLNSIFTLVSFSTVIVVTLGILLSPLIVKLFFKNIADYNSTVFLTRIMFPYLFLISVAAFFQGILNGVKIFTPSGFTPILFNIIVISSTYIFAKPFGDPAAAMSYGVVAGGLVQAVFQLPFVLKTGFSFKFTSLAKTFSNPGTKKVLALIGPTIIGMAAYQINDLVSTSLATSAGLGIASSLQYSLRLQELLLGIFAVSVGTVILPEMSALALRKDWEAFQKVLLQAIKVIALITIPATFFSLLSGENLIILIYKSNKFDSASVKLTLGIFNFHIIGLFAIAVNRIIAPAFYAQSDSKSPTIAGIICFAVNILLALILVGPMGGNGIALALTIASVINTIILLIFLKKNKALDVKNLIFPALLFIAKIFVFSIAASIPLYFLKDKIYSPFASFGKLIGQGVPLFISFIIFAGLGAGLLLITKDRTANIILNRLKEK